jgi:hypothetical protein
VSSGGWTATGRGGRLTVAGRPAATLGAWALTGTAGGWRLEAALAAHDPYWLDAGGPFALVLPLGREHRWTWRRLPGAGLAWDAAALTLTLTGEEQPERD